MVLGATEFWVSPTGNDAASGIQAAPFKTLERARDAVRGLSPEARQKKTTVWLHGGTYERTTAFALTSEDQGSKDAPLEFRAVKGERPCLSGGRRLSGSSFVPVRDADVLARIDPAAREKIRVCDLRHQEIQNFGEMSRQALNGGAMLELFFNGDSLPLSRWPNAKNWEKYGKVIDAGSIPRWNEKPDRPGTFEYKGDRPRRWSKAPEIWLHGYWAFDWYDDVMKVAKMDTEKRQITFATPHTYGLKTGRRFAALNLLEEIDVPGEWMLDRSSGMLYIYPPDEITKADIVISMCAEPLVTLTKTKWVVLRGLTFEFGRASAVRLFGGTDNLIASCTVRNMGTSAINIGAAESKTEGHLTREFNDELIDGRRNGVVGCNIYDVGTSGIGLNGGDRVTLAAGGHYAENNDIHHYSRRKRTGCPAIGLGGVGNRARYNYIHDAPHCGLNYGGNDHLIELNEFARMCWETGDVGVIYTGRNWTCRGNVVKHNFIHHSIAPGHVGSMGVYLDDSHSSTAIVGNVFYQCDYAAFVGGGHDNAIENNIFIDCDKAAHIDNRSQGWAHKYQIRGADHRMFAKLEEVHYNQPPYSVRYPKLAKILDGDPHLPTGNSIERNVCVRGNRWLHLFPKAETVVSIKENLVTKEDPGFVDMDSMNFALKDDSLVYREIPGFEKIPFAQIGLRLDEYRSALPLRAPRMTPDGGAFAKDFELTIKAESATAAIRYTLDGSEPNRNSIAYNAPIPVNQSMTVTAVSFPDGDLGTRPSPVCAATFTKIEFGKGKGVFLSDLSAESSFAHAGLIKDKNYKRNDFITFDGKVHRKGIMICPEKRKEGKGSFSEATYSLKSPLDYAKFFRAEIGIDDGADYRGTASFRVELLKKGKWETVFQGPILYGRPKAEQIEVEVKLDGAKALRLSTDGGDDISADHAAWGSARLE